MVASYISLVFVLFTCFGLIQKVYLSQCQSDQPSYTDSMRFLSRMKICFAWIGTAKHDAAFVVIAFVVMVVKK